MSSIWSMCSSTYPRCLPCSTSDLLERRGGKVTPSLVYFTNVQRLYRKGLFGVWESTDTMEVSFLFLHFYIRTASWEEPPFLCLLLPLVLFPVLLVVRRPTLVFLSRFRIAARHIALHLHTQILGNNLGRIFDTLLRPVRGDSGCWFFFFSLEQFH